MYNFNIKKRLINYLFLICFLNAFNSDIHWELLDNQSLIDNSRMLKESVLNQKPSKFIDYNNISFKSEGYFLDKNPLYIASLMFEGDISSFHYCINPIFVNKDNVKLILGNDYHRYNMGGSFENTFLRYNGSDFFISIGGQPIRWGESSISSIIHSGISPSFNKFLVNIEKYGFRFEMFSGQLNSAVSNSSDSDEGQRIKRFIAGHRLTWKFKKKISLSFGEQIIYSGLNRGLEMAYLNPFMPFFVVGLENKENEFNTINGGDNDNSMLFLHGRFNLNKFMSIYSELIIDDYQIDKTIRDNQSGFTIGLDGIWKDNSRFVWAFEWTKIDPWTYLHQGQFTNWTHKDHPIGYHFGLDLENFQFHFKYKINNNLDLISNFNYLRKGPNSFESNWENNNQEDQNIENEYFFVNSLSIIKKLNNLMLKIGFSNNLIKNDFAIINNNINQKNNFFIGLSYFFNTKKVLNKNND